MANQDPTPRITPYDDPPNQTQFHSSSSGFQNQNVNLNSNQCYSTPPTFNEFSIRSRTQRSNPTSHYANQEQYYDYSFNYNAPIFKSQIGPFFMTPDGPVYLTSPIRCVLPTSIESPFQVRQANKFSFKKSEIYTYDEEKDIFHKREIYYELDSDSNDK